MLARELVGLEYFTIKAKNVPLQLTVKEFLPDD
jgi:hypothetical protein